MNPRAAQIAALLDLAPHPEGGRYREVHRSAQLVTRDDGAVRAALPTIYFLLAADERSQWHRVAADEAWHFQEGAILELDVATPDATRLHRQLLGPLADGVQPVHVVPAGYWQAARTRGEYSLVACSVGPGFDFADFVLARDLTGEPAAIRERLEQLERSERRGRA